MNKNYIFLLTNLMKSLHISKIITTFAPSIETVSVLAGPISTL